MIHTDIRPHTSSTRKDNLFLPYQKRWIEDNAPMKILEKSRQIGMTWATASSLVLRQRRQPEGSTAWVSSRDETQARLFIEDCRRFNKLLNVLYKGPEFKETGRCTGFRMELKDCGAIHALSSNPDAQAGKRGIRVLDEFALNPDPQKLYAIAYPGITWGGSLEILSTHRGSANYFNQLIEEVRHKGNPKRFSYHRVTLQDALDQGFLKKLQSKLSESDPRFHMDDASYFDYIRNGCPNEESFRQEYMCDPSDDQSAFLSYGLIHSCEYPSHENWELCLDSPQEMYLQNPLYLGIDIGRSHDLSVFWLLERVNEIFFTRKIVTLKDTPFYEQEAVLNQFCALPNLRRICIDQSGLGRQFVERAQQRFGKYRVEGIHFTSQSKEALAYPLRSAFECRNLRIPQDKFIRSDLRAIKKEPTASGNIRFTADRGKNGHSDRFWALALALHAIGKPAARAYYEPIQTGSPRNSALQCEAETAYSAQIFQL